MRPALMSSSNIVKGDAGQNHRSTRRYVRATRENRLIKDAVSPITRAQATCSNSVSAEWAVVLASSKLTPYGSLKLTPSFCDLERC